MRVKFLKPAPGYAYSEKMLGDLPKEDAELLIKKGYAVEAGKDKIDTDLPEDFPLRGLLIKEGFGKLNDIKNNLEAVNEIKGVGDKTFKEIVERLNS